MRLETPEIKILSVPLLSQAKKSECGTAHFVGLDSYKKTLRYSPTMVDVSIVNETSPLQKLTGTDRQRTHKTAYKKMVLTIVTATYVSKGHLTFFKK